MDTVHECDRQTDRRTDGRTDRITITDTVQRRASHGNKREGMHSVARVKRLKVRRPIDLNRNSSERHLPYDSSTKSGCLQLLEILEISWNFFDATGKFNCQLKYDNKPITKPNLVMSLNPRNSHLTTFCAVLFIMSYIT